MSFKPLLDAYRDFLSLRPEPKVQEWVEAIDWNMVERDLPPQTYSCARQLEGLEAYGNASTNRVIKTLQENADKLHWMRSYTADDFGQEFLDGYGHIEIIGTRGCFVNDQFSGGVVMYGPNTNYPNHWHVAEEIYFPLTSGALWGKDDGPLQERKAGEFIFHESNEHHEMKMQDAPLLALWMWHGGDLAQKCDY